MLLWIKYSAYYLLSQYHQLRMKKLVDKRLKDCANMNDKTFVNLVGKYVKHSRKFKDVQVTLDALKIKICNKYPDLKYKD